MNMDSYSCCVDNTKELTNVAKLASLLKLVGDENRLKILCVLLQGTHCVCEITQHLTLSQSLASHHLKDLKDAELVVDAKKGLKVFYSLTSRGKVITKHLFQIINKEVKSG